MYSVMDGKAGKILLLVIVTLFSIPSMGFAQGNVQIHQVGNSSGATVHYPGAEKKMIYPSEIKSILVKEQGETCQGARGNVR